MHFETFIALDSSFKVISKRSVKSQTGQFSIYMFKEALNQKKGEELLSIKNPSPTKRA